MEILPFLISLAILALSISIYIKSKKRTPEWKYVIRQTGGRRLPNVDQGYWEIEGPVGQKLRFTDDAVDIAHKRYLSNEGDGIKFSDSNFSPTK